MLLQSVAPDPDPDAPPPPQADPASQPDAPASEVRPASEVPPEAPPSHPAEVLPHPRPVERPAKPSVGRWLVAIALIVGGALGGYLLWRPPADEQRPRDAMVVAAERMPRLRATLETSDAGAAQRYLEAQTSETITPPRLEGYTLQGVTMDRVLRGLTVPALLYTADDGSTAAVYLYTYARLDATEGRLRLARNVLAELATEDRHTQDLGSHTATLWRQRATIFIAIAPSPVVPAD